MTATLPDATLVPQTIDPNVLSALAAALAPYMQGSIQQNRTAPPEQLALVHGTQEGHIFRNGPPNVNNLTDVSSQTIDLLKAATQAELVRTGVNVATGYIGYDLKVPAATLVPFLTPMINMTAREDGVGVDVHNWKALTDFFGGSGPQGVVGSVTDGGSPSFLSRTIVSMANTFQSIGFQDSLTFKAQWRGKQLEGDLRAKIAAQVLFGLKLVEENWLINMSDKLWTPPPPLVSASTSGGALASGNYWVAVTAMNASNGETLPTATLGPFNVASGSAGSLAVTVFTVPFATKYNVYVATNSTKPATSAMWLQTATLWTLRTPDSLSGSHALDQPANPTLGSFTVTLSGSLATSGTALNAVTANTAVISADGGGNALTWQGAQALVYNNFAANAGNGTGGLKGQVIQPAASTGYLALSDIQQLFLNLYQNARARPEYLFVNPQDGITITNLVTQSGNVRVVVDASQPALQGQLQAGYNVGQILNQATNTMVRIVPLPFLAQGSIMAGSYSFPYPVAGFSDTPFRIICNQEYYGVDYPPTMQNPTQWGWGAFVDSTVTNEFLGGWGCLNGIVYH